MEKKERKSLGKVNFLDGRSLKKMFDEKPGDSGILVGVMAKYAEGLNLIGAGAKITENMIHDVMFLGEVCLVTTEAVHIKQYHCVFEPGVTKPEEIYRIYVYRLSDVTLTLPTVEQFVAMTNEVVYVEGGEAYVDETHYASVYCVIGNKQTKTQGVASTGTSSYYHQEELNGIFCKEDDARRMGDMLVSFGEIDGISYPSYEIREMLVL